MSLKKGNQMKKTFIMLSIPAILISGGLKKSLLQSNKEQKPLMVLVTAENCKYCRKMKKETLENSEVKSNLEGFLFATVRKSSRDAKQFLPNTRYTPTVYFVSPKYKIINSVKGYLAATDFNLWVDDTRAKLGMPTQKRESKIKESKYVQPEKDSVWMYDMASAIDFAEQTEKQIMVFVGSTRSKWSKQMESTTLESKKVKKELENFVWVKLNYGDKDAKEYGIKPKHVPTVYFMKNNLEELAVAKGYFKQNDFLKWVKYAKSKI